MEMEKYEGPGITPTSVPSQDPKAILVAPVAVYIFGATTTIGVNAVLVANVAGVYNTVGLWG